jgi:hypothetical protein
MPRVVLVLLLLLVANSASAGPNAGGVLLVHWNPQIAYTGDAVFFDGGLSECNACITQAPPCSAIPAPDDQRRIWFAYAAFPPGSMPVMFAVAFGIDFHRFSGSEGVVVNWAQREETAVELASPGWPAIPGTGTMLLFDAPKHGLVEQVYEFAGYATAGQVFSIVNHPDMPAEFADNTIPPHVEVAVALGSLGFGVEGSLSCPGPAQGACCLTQEDCEIMSPADCRHQAGNYLGNGTVCAPALCDQPIRLCDFPDHHCENLMHDACFNYGGLWNPTTTCNGACCLPDGRCLSISEQNCENWRGTYMGVDVPCEPDPCHGTPIEMTTWGQIKCRYR